MKKYTLIAMVVLLSGCVEAVEPVSSERSNNPQVPVALLFEHDDCKVYRFVDAGRYHYFSRCERSSSVTAEWNESCGKSCTRRISEETTTGYIEP